MKRADVVANVFAQPLWTDQEERFDPRSATGPSRLSEGGDAGVGGYPPLYYAALAIPYKLAAWAGGDPLDRLTRCGSARRCSWRSRSCS